MKKFGSAFLHIGFDKTGFTAIQVTLDRSRDFLLKDEVLDQSRTNNEFLEREFGIKFQESRSDYLIGEDQKYTSETENLLRSIAEINILMERDRPTRTNQVHLDKRKPILVRLKQIRNKFVDTHVND